MKEALIVFFVAFGLTIGCSALKLLWSPSPLSFFIFSFTYLSAIILTIIGIGIFFGTFYFIAVKGNVVAKKSIAVAILLGITLGGVVSVFLMFSFDVLLASTFEMVFVFSSFVSGSVVFYFFPSMTSLLLVELRNKKQLSLTSSTLQN